jgi:exopolyphosphatase/guanosine-5'-triphosphate,3'-diphosphate pyrophosphatase
LANVGLVISHSKHHLHSYYVIRNSELTGLTDAEIEIIAQIARYHRKSAPKAGHAEFGRLSADDQSLVKTLAGILRVAIGLDRSHDGRVRSVSALQLGDRVVIEAVSKRGKEISLELYTANERSGLLEEVIGRRVDIVAAPLPSS